MTAENLIPQEIIQLSQDYRFSVIITNHHSLGGPRDLPRYRLSALPAPHIIACFHSWQIHHSLIWKMVLKEASILHRENPLGRKDVSILNVYQFK